MENKTLSIQYTLFCSLNELTPEDLCIVREAISMLSSSYAPYSQFHVGSAAMLEDGTVVKGSNQENVAFPSGLCAERVALFSAGSQHSGKAVQRIAIAACDFRNCFHAVFPCGGCLQVMSEYERLSGTAMRIIVFQNEKQIFLFEGVQNLMPFTFHLAQTAATNKYI